MLARANRPETREKMIAALALADGRFQMALASRLALSREGAEALLDAVGLADHVGHRHPVVRHDHRLGGGETPNHASRFLLAIPHPQRVHAVTPAGAVRVFLSAITQVINWATSR